TGDIESQNVIETDERSKKKRKGGMTLKIAEIESGLKIMKADAQRQSEFVLIEEKKDATIAKHWAKRDNAKNIEKLRSMQQEDNKKQTEDNKENTKRE
ncbi:37376_t:CDS:1, partial [Gigaspora margarita]